MRTKTNSIIDFNKRELSLILKAAIITALTSFAIKSFAVNCSDENSCWSKGATLIKQATRLNKKNNTQYCLSEIRALSGELSKQAKIGSENYENLETCLTNAKDLAKIAKKAEKRKERLNKALSGE